MTYRVIQDYARQYDDPIAFKRGESITREQEDPNQPGWWWCIDKRGKSGWVHESYFEYDDGRYLGTDNYTALELSVQADEHLAVLDERGDWAWCESNVGERGWVPMHHLAPLI